MTARNIKDYDLFTTAIMTFDEVFPDICSAIDDNATSKCTSHSNSTSCDEQQKANIHNLVPISPCFSEVSPTSSAADIDMSITGQFSNIEYKYHVDPRVLGTGHYGSVRECIDRVTGQRYAVKSICKSGPAVEPGSHASEIMLLREINHRNIIQLVDVYEDAEYLHLVTDLCDGGELFDKIIDKSSCDNGATCFAEDEAAKIMYQILTAVSYMHKHDIAHRDIKPENILFETKDEDSPIKIIDFGLARKHFGSLGEPPMTTIVGTPYYIAPEVLRKSYDKSCDLWSVGVIAYMLLTGCAPFNGNNDSEVYDAVRQGQYHFPSADWSGTSSEACDFIHRLLQKDQRKRMTVEQALNHPWIVKHANTHATIIEEEREDKSSGHVVVKGLRMSRKGSMLCSRIGKCKMRISLFCK